MEVKRTILDKIKEENVRQRPKWYFKVIQFITMACYFACILIGAASFSVILFSLQQTDFNVLSHLSHSKLELLLGLLPIFWMATLLVFIILSIVVFRKSPRGYKYHWIKLFGFNTLASIIIGTLFFIVGGGHQLEHAFAEKVSSYESIHEMKIKTWMQPDKGFLAGKILSIEGTRLQLEDFDGKKWNIAFPEAFVAGRVTLEVGSEIKLIGKMSGDVQFTASEIRPWIGKRSFRDLNLP